MQHSLLLLLCVSAVVHCTGASWLSGPRRALAQDSASLPLTQANGSPASTSTGTVSVSNADAFVSALLSKDVNTIRVATDVVINSTRARAQLIQAVGGNGVVDLTRSLTIVGVSLVRPGSNRSSLALLDFGMLTGFLRLSFASSLEFRALHIRGMYELLDDVPSILTSDSVGNVIFSSVVSQRTACLPPSQQLQKIMDAGGVDNSGSRTSNGGGSDSAGGGKTNTGLVADTSAPSPPAEPEISMAADADVGSAFAAPASALLYDSSYCMPAVLGADAGGGGGGSGGALATDECFDSPLLLQDFSFTVSIKSAGSGTPTPEESPLDPPGASGAGGDGAIGLLPGLRVSFNMTIVLCDVIVEGPCAEASGKELQECVRLLLEAKNGRPPPSPPAPPRPPPPVLPPATPARAPPAPGLVLGERGPRPVPLTATLLPALLGSLVLSAAVGVFVVWRRRRSRRDPGSGPVCFGKLEQQDSDQLEMEMGGGGGGGPGGGGGGGKAASGDVLLAKASDGDGRSTAGTAATRYGKYRGGGGGGGGGSAAGTMSSRGLTSSTTSGLTTALMTPGASPADSCGTDPSKSIALHHMLGSGSFGRVYYGTWQGQGVAVKIIPHTSAANAKVQQEVSLCTRFQHPHVVRCLHCVTFESGAEAQLTQVESLRSTSTATSSQPAQNMETWIVLEFCNAGSLSSHLSLKAAALGTAGPSACSGAATLCGQESAASASLAGQPGQGPGPGAGLGAGPGSCLLGSPNTSLGLSGGQQQQRDAALTHMRGVLSVARDIAAGMAYLHSLNVCHGDLKCENVLLTFENDAAGAGVAAAAGDEPQRASCGGSAGAGGAGGAPAPAEDAAASTAEGAAAGPCSASSNAACGRPANAAPFVAKVADFGLSKTFSDVSTHMSTATVGTVTHMCPVLLLTGQMRPSCDVFSFGIMLWQITTGGTPFAGMRYAEIVYKVAVAGLRPEFPPHVPRRLVEVAEACWAADPNARPTFEQLVSRLGELLDAAESLQAEQDAALAAARAGAARAEDVVVAAASSEEEKKVASTWAAAAAAALLE